jgi:N-glycosidase YbiA
MPTLYVSGDLFENEHDARAFAHGCNCQGSMGAGVARTFRARYPEMYEEYRRRCKTQPRQFNLGDCWLWRQDDQPCVFNLGTQEGFWRSRASYEAIETALRAMRRQADAQDITSIAIPRIGVGYGGLSWKKVRAIVEAVFGDWAGTLVVYEEFVPVEVAQSAEQADPRTSTAAAVSESAPSGSVRGAASQAIFEFDRPEQGDNVINEVINFYSASEAYGCFSNFSPHPIKLDGKTWPTSEHYFQARKFAGTPDEEEVRLAKSPMIAARMGRSRKRPLRKDWESVKDTIMHEAVVAKFTQHADLREILLATGDAKLVEHTENDDYWGDGGDGSGKNKLGQILMRVREEWART